MAGTDNMDWDQSLKTMWATYSEVVGISHTSNYAVPRACVSNARINTKSVRLCPDLEEVMAGISYVPCGRSLVPPPGMYPSLQCVKESLRDGTRRKVMFKIPTMCIT